MNLNEPIHQNTSSGISKIPGEVSTGKRVLCLGSLKDENRRQKAQGTLKKKKKDESAIISV